MSREAIMKLSEEALCLLIKEVLDLPNDVEIVSMRSVPLEAAVLLQLEGDSLPEGATGVLVEYQKVPPYRLGDGRRLLARRFIRFTDAQDINRPLASVPDPAPSGLTGVIDLDPRLDVLRRKG